MPPEVRYARTTDGVNIAYVALGSGPVLFDLPTPPYDDTELTWLIADYQEVFETMSKVVTLVRYDVRGFGLSDRNVDDFSLEAMVRDMEAVVAAVGADRFAISAWAEITIPALVFAAQHSDSVVGMVLREGMVRGTDGGEDRALALARDDWSAATRMMADALPNVASVASLRQMHDLINHTTTQEGYIRFRECVATWDATPFLKSVTVSTLVTNDGWLGVPKEVSRRLAVSLPDASFVSHPTPRGERSPSDAATGDFLAARYASAQATEREPRQSGVRTVLFTDIVGHTEMMQRLGDAKGRDVLREHERITRQVLSAHGGTEVKTMGDGFMASFGSVTSAMECAIALQRAFAMHTESMPEPLRVRVGLNAGEPIEEDGDLFGATVILASRIAAKAGAGEILVPDTVRGLLSGKGFVFGDRGEFVPKGFDEGVRVWDVRWQE